MLVETLEAVQLQSQASAGKMIRFEIVATASPKFFGAFVKPPPEDTAEKDADNEKKAGDQ